MKLLMDEKQLLEIDELKTTNEQAHQEQVKKLKHMKIRFAKEREDALRQAPVEADCRGLLWMCFFSS